MTPEQEEYGDEAARLALLPREDQAAVVHMYRHLADNTLATQACRADAEKKAAVLEKLLGLKPARKPARTPVRADSRKTSAKSRKS